jgi:hypothetical protein
LGLVVLRGRPAGGGRKPPQAAAVKSRGGERLRKSRAVSAAGVGQEGERKRSIDDVSKRLDDIETEVEYLSRDEPGGYLSTAQAVSGMKMAGAWSGLRCGTWEPAPRYGGQRNGHGAHWPCGLRERDVRAAESVRARVALRGAGADRPVVAMKPGNAGGATGVGHLGLLGGQPR